ncbi:E3 ubiquitin-protein ligase Godzilla [Chironomus tepperi]|uniref:E3 ubiquitin-protein ligase Godzilla n=1 Tax=Chironomus tepperi TaxID=113505 RepID=UPI00391F979A
MHTIISYAVLIFIGIKNTHCDVLVYENPTNRLVEEFQSLAARFGPNFPPNGMRVYAVQGEPPDGCAPMEEAPKNYTIHGTPMRFAAVISRGDCTFADKVRHAQNASFDAVIVYNKDSDALEIMSASDDSDIFIPSLFVGQTSGSIIMFDYNYSRKFFLILNDDFPFNINTHLIIPFCIVIGMCFVIMLGFMISRCVRERRRIMRYRLPTSSLKKLESRKYTKNEIYETCAICLDDYEEGDRLRILPCRHAYHTKCIDVWLTKNRRVCPICKRKVYTIGERRRQRRRRSADSTTDSMSSFDPDDTTPLINPQDANANHGTFNENNQEQTQDENEALEAGQQNQNEASDDEMLDGRPPSNQRFNPFNRVDNLPPVADELIVTVEGPNDSIWTKFKRFFRVSHQTADDDDPPLLDNTVTAATDDVDIIIRPDSSHTINIARPIAGNNILNSNLSGSFREENETLNNHNSNINNSSDNSLSNGQVRADSSKRAHRSAPNIMQRDEPSTSSGSPRRIGVAAIPNLQFLSRPSQNRNRLI